MEKVAQVAWTPDRPQAANRILAEYRIGKYQNDVLPVLQVVDNVLKKAGRRRDEDPAVRKYTALRTTAQALRSLAR